MADWMHRVLLVDLRRISTGREEQECAPLPNLKLRQSGAGPTVAALCIAFEPHLITSRTRPAMAQFAASPSPNQPEIGGAVTFD